MDKKTQGEDSHVKWERDLSQDTDFYETVLWQAEVALNKTKSSLQRHYFANKGLSSQGKSSQVNLNV